MAESSIGVTTEGGAPNPDFIGSGDMAVLRDAERFRASQQSNVIPLRGVDVRPPSASALERLGEAFGGPRPGAPAPAPPADAQGGGAAVPAPAPATAPAPAGRPADPPGWFGVPVWVWLLGAAAVAAFLIWRMQPKRRRR